MEKASETVRLLGFCLAFLGMAAVLCFGTGCATADKQDEFPVRAQARSSVGFASGNPIIQVVKQNVIEAQSVERLLQVLLGTGSDAESATLLATMTPEERAATLSTLFRHFDSLFRDNAPVATLSVGSSAGELAVTQRQSAQQTAQQGDTTQTPTTDIKPTISTAVGPQASSTATGGEGTTGGGTSGRPTPPDTAPPVPVPDPAPEPDPTPEPPADPISLHTQEDILLALLRAWRP